MHGAAPPRGPAAAAARRLRDLLELIDDARTALSAAPACAGPPARDAGWTAQSAMEARPPSSESSAASSGPLPSAASSSGPRPPLRARASRRLAHTDVTPRAAVSSGMTHDGSEEAGVEPQHADSWRLVRLAQDGSGEAFALLYDRYVEMVFRFLYFKVNDKALAEDFTSETFLRALRRIGTLSYQGRDIGAWFLTIARNLVLDHVKSARSRLESLTGDPVEVVDRGAGTPSTETAVLDSLRSQQLMKAVNALGEEQRECIVLRFIQGLSVSETAQIMGKKDGAIKALQHRAVRKLADLVGDELR